MSPEGDLIFIGVACVVAAIALSVLVLVARARSRREREKMAALTVANVDAMTGTEFEHYLRWLLSCRGFAVDTTPATGDLGVDLVATARGARIAIQAKRQRRPVSRRAVSDAVAGMAHYRCTQAMVITNGDYTAGAVTLARSTGCVLVDRVQLARWVQEATTTASSAK